jgi:hypothetical protein
LLEASEGVDSAVLAQLQQEMDELHDYSEDLELKIDEQHDVIARQVNEYRAVGF